MDNFPICQPIAPLAVDHRTYSADHSGSLVSLLGLSDLTMKGTDRSDHQDCGSLRDNQGIRGRFSACERSRFALRHITTPI